MIVLDGTNGVTYPVQAGSASTTQASASKVLQVVVAPINARYSITSTSFAGVGPTLSITPISSTSRILLMTTLSIQYENYSYHTFFRNGINVSGTYGIITYGATSSTIWQNTSFSFVDTPNTTSPITYQVALYSTSGTIYLNDYSSNNTSHLIAMEIEQ